MVYLKEVNGRLRIFVTIVFISSILFTVAAPVHFALKIVVDVTFLILAFVAWIAIQLNTQ